MTEAVSVTGQDTVVAVPGVSVIETIRVSDTQVLTIERSTLELVEVAGPVTVLQAPTARVEVVTVAAPVVEIITVGAGTGSGGAPAFDDLPLADATPLPDYIAAVQQNGTWKRTTWAQFTAWLGAISDIPDGALLDGAEYLLDGTDYLVDA